MAESKEPRISPFSFDPKHYFKYLLFLVLLLCVYGVLIFFGSSTVNRKHTIETIVSIAEHLSRVVPLGIIIVITVEGVIRKMFAAYEDFKQWRRSRIRWIAQRVKKEASEVVKEASEAVKKEASEAVRQELQKQLLAMQQRYQDDMNAWVERRVEAERKGEPFNEPMPTLLDVADDSARHQKGESQAEEATP